MHQLCVRRYNRDKGSKSEQVSTAAALCGPPCRWVTPSTLRAVREGWHGRHESLWERWSQTRSQRSGEAFCEMFDMEPEWLTESERCERIFTELTESWESQKDGSQRERLLWFPSSEIYLVWGDCWFLGGHENSEDREPAWGQSMWGLTNYIKKVRHWEDKTLWRIFKKRGTGISVCLSFLLWVCMDEDWGGTTDMSQNIPKVDDYLI